MLTEAAKKPVRYRAKLDTPEDIRRELARVYRENKSGLLDNQDAEKQVMMLMAISQLILEISRK
jgi:hypothetical protein